MECYDHEKEKKEIRNADYVLLEKKNINMEWDGPFNMFHPSFSPNKQTTCHAMCTSGELKQWKYEGKKR